jgi:succinate-semialdehyde dehydrogenase/glutarate-semialdehyde dehydrogenase
MSFQTFNPATGEAIRSYPLHDGVQLERRLTWSRQAFADWSRRPISERVQSLTRLARLLRQDPRPHAERMTQEMGKPIAQGLAELEKCAWVCEHYAATAESSLADRVIETEASKSYLSHRPLGVVLAVMPWNFPYWQVIRMAAPTLAAGNVVLLKHAEVTTGCALLLEDLFTAAGFPPGVFQSLLVDHDTLAELIAGGAVDAVTLTGSTRAGRAVGESTGRAIKKVVLELGGSDPSLVLEDADLEAAAASCVASRLINTGQSCIAAKRLIVVEPVRERFTELVVEAMSAVEPSDPTSEDCELGPMARLDLRDELHSQVTRSVEAGASLLLGGEVPDRPGAWYPPTVLSGVRPGMPAWSEELFGPVAVIVSAGDESEAIAIANDTPYGLGASVYTADLERGERIARDELVAGTCTVNDFVKSDPRLPFGGTKRSGLGRELGPDGLLEFTNAKTVVVR